MIDKLLTISIAAYNDEKYIKECLDSILPCKNKDLLEIFVIDDGGIDNTLDIAKEYSENYKNIVFPIHKDNGGWGSTVNYSISNGHGKYLLVLDGDDLLDKNNFERFVDDIKNIESDLIINPYKEIDMDTKKIIRLDTVNDEIQMHNFVFKRDLLSDSLVLEKCFYTDIQLVFNSFSVSKTYINIDYPIYLYRIGRAGQSISKNGFLKHYEEHKKVVLSVLYIYNKYFNNFDSFIKEISLRRVITLTKKHISLMFMKKISYKNYIEIIDFDNILYEKYYNIYKLINLKRIILLRLVKCYIVYIIETIFLHFRSYIYDKLK